MKRVVSAVSLALVFVLAFALLGMAVTPAYAQVSKGSISGSVTDPQGALVTGASSTAVSKDTNHRLQRRATALASFVLACFLPGTYRVRSHQAMLPQNRVWTMLMFPRRRPPVWGNQA